MVAPHSSSYIIAKGMLVIQNAPKELFSNSKNRNLVLCYHRRLMLIKIIMISWLYVAVINEVGLW